VSKSASKPARWALQDAKNRLSEVVDAAVRGQPQIVTRRGIETAVVISHEAYEQITGARARAMPALTDYLLAMPTARGADPFERIALAPRDSEW
jgi:prevent-host-death family protein